MKSGQRLLELDSLRGLAALGVVMYHYFYRYNDIYGHPELSVSWSYVGKFGVQLFFVISGFVIFWSLNRIKRPLDFIVSRFARLYPPFWCAVILTYVFTSIFGLAGREVAPKYFIANFLMFHEYLRVPHVDGVYWTLTVELTFYFWIFVVFLAGQLKNIELILISFVLTYTVIISAGWEVPSPIEKILILKYLPFFVSGISFYKISNNGLCFRQGVVVLLCLLSTLFLYTPIHFFLFFLLYCLFYLVVIGKLPFFRSKPLVFLGSISYSLYLIHQNIGYVIINEFYEHNISVELGVLTAIFISVVVAFSFVKLVEQPSLRFIKNTYNQNPKYQKIAERLRFGVKT